MLNGTLFGLDTAPEAAHGESAKRIFQPYRNTGIAAVPLGCPCKCGLPGDVLQQ
jgi:hypothetical protein